MKKILSILSILPCIAMAELVPTDGVISSDFVQSGNQTGTNAIANQLNIASGSELLVTGDLEIANDTDPVNNLGYIMVSEGASLTINSANATPGANKAWSSNIGNLVVSGKLYSIVGNSAGLHLASTTAKALTNITLESTGLIYLEKGRLGFNNYYTNITLNASVSKNDKNEWQTGLITNLIHQSRGGGARYAIEINAKDAFCKDDGSATDVSTWTNSDLILDFSNADGMTDLGTVYFRGKTTLKVIMSATPDTFTINKLARYSSGDGAVEATLAFENFANNLVKINDFDETRLTDDGIYTFEAGTDTITITITATNGDISSANGEWYVANGFLNNTAFGASVPEPAEWAMILGSLALGLAIYKRRK